MKELLIKDCLLTTIGNSYGFLINKNLVDDLGLLDSSLRYTLRVELDNASPSISPLDKSSSNGGANDKKEVKGKPYCFGRP